MTAESATRLTDSSSPPDIEPNDVEGLISMKKNGKLPTQVIVNEYQKYRKKLRETGLLAYKGIATTELFSNLRELEDLYQTVLKNPSLRAELIDAQALNDTSNYAAINAKNLKFGDLGIELNNEDFLSQLNEYLIDSTISVKTKQNLLNSSSKSASILSDKNDVTEDVFNSFNWLKLGLLYYNVSSSPIPMEFLNGPIEAEKKIRVRKRNIDDTKGLKDTTTAQQVELNDLETNDELNTARLVRTVFKTFHDKQVNQPKKEPINFFKFFINPNSFSQSVENLFFTSFLIRDARLKLTVKNDIPMVSMVDNSETRRILQRTEQQVTSNHHIASFDYETWEQLIKTHNITESYLGHRNIEADVFDKRYEDDEESEDESDDEEINKELAKILSDGDDNDPIEDSGDENTSLRDEDEDEDEEKNDRNNIEKPPENSDSDDDESSMVLRTRRKRRRLV